MKLFWFYKGGFTNTKTCYPRNHDNIFIYSKTNKHNFKPLRKPLNKEELEKVSLWKRWGKFSEDGKSIKLRNIPMTDTINRQRQINGFKNRNGRMPKQGDVVYELQAPLLESVWDDCSPVYRLKEKLGCPTQKPLKLLNRLIETFTNKNDMIAGFFCGCGTTISSAQNLGRQWFGCDISEQAIKVIRKRMIRDHNLKIQVKKTGALTNKEVLRLNPFEFESYVVSLIGIPNKKQRGDGGIDGFTYDRIPIQVKKSYKVGRPVLDSLYKHIEQRGAGNYNSP